MTLPSTGKHPGSVVEAVASTRQSAGSLAFDQAVSRGHIPGAGKRQRNQRSVIQPLGTRLRATRYGRL